MELTTILNTLVSGTDLSTEESNELVSSIMQGNGTPAQIGAILTALRIKGETPDEIVGAVKAMREHMLRVEAPGAVDVCGTGGDGSGTFNISTCVAFVVASAGVPMAKHGNRAASSKCGGADVLEALGVNIALTPSQATEVFKRVGMLFLFAPTYHPAMKYVAPVRRELKIKTIFNILGPFANPAGVTRQLIGVADIALAEKMATAAQSLGYERLFIVTSEDGLDEISLCAKTHLFDVHDGAVTRSVIDPTAYGFTLAQPNDLIGGDAAENAQILKAILSGERGPKRDVVVLNSAYALLAAGKVNDVAAGIRAAEQSIDSGAATSVLTRLIAETNEAHA